MARRRMPAWRCFFQRCLLSLLITPSSFTYEQLGLISKVGIHPIPILLSIYEFVAAYWISQCFLEIRISYVRLRDILGFVSPFSFMP
ncbi:hypothetical protein DFS33DRAFT_1072027 [Desarmillaria ectypa]|nr:hypothetical protein DFS33DRAFT_1072027 [Desarmillaria ectypa]